MKKILLVAIALSMLLSIVYAKEMPVGINKKAIDIPQGYRIPQTRTVPEFTFTKLPTALITNYYDYMIGSYNGLPLRVIPQSAGGGYFMTYFGRRQPTSTRRVFYSYLDAAGNVINNNEITSVQNHEGYPTLAVDPVSGKPMYAWHCNADADAEFEVQFTSDAFIAGIAGLFNDLQIVANGPVTITSPSGITTTNNEFIWPTAQIGPSPIANKRRVYVAMRNSVSATAGPSENLYIAYADFSGDDIENGVALTWSHTSIPEMNNWNVDAVEWRRPFHAITADNAGNIYYAGYHFAVDANSNDIPEADMDVFICPNYGQGTWTRISDFSNIPAWNPPSTPTGGPGYFTDANSTPYPNSALTFAMANSSHLNAVVDGLGKVQVPAVWALTTNEGTYYPAMQFVKSFIFDPATQEYEMREIYPQKDPSDNFNACFMPWDTEEPWGVAEYIQEGGTWYPAIATDWPFPHWDTSAHSDAMLFHYNNIKMSEANDQGMMVTLWQNAQRARWFNLYSDTDYAQFANTPEIWISVSPNNGGVWSEPIVLNNVETPQFAGLKPMWVYPADKVIYTGMQGNQKVGKIGVMFYNDFTWGSNAITPSYHPTPDGGEVMFMELQVVFPPAVDNNDNTVAPIAKTLHQNYPNPFNPETTISFDMPKAGNANLSVYNVKGQLVKNLINGTLGFGKQSIVWNGTDSNGNSVPSGLYFYRLTANGNTETMKMMLMK
ncbi:MAG: T9SS type A sorting domain-containing protein [Candidatus Cloacimonadaceae bacterium]|nr:T9SS type A sorting domain-containing protein [Candidatus Cloacimonadaceae bacterium]